MDHYVTTEAYKAFLNSLPKYNHVVKFRMLQPFLQKLAVSIVHHFFPNEGVEWFSDTKESSNNDVKVFLVKTELPENIHQTDVNFIPENKLDYMKTGYIKASFNMYFEEGHPRAGDDFDGWFLEILLPDGGTFTLRNSDPHIYCTSKSDLLYFRKELPKHINSSI